MDLLNKSSKKCILESDKLKNILKKLKIPIINKNSFFKKIQKEFIYYYQQNYKKINQNSIQLNDLNKISNNDSYFIAEKFQKKIKELKYCYVFHYENNIIYFKSNKKIIKKIPKKIIYMFIIILTLKDLFQRSHCSQQIIFYDLFDKKSIPLKKNSYIDQENCNSAFCTVQYDEKINGPIVLFRNEECLKVLIHELIHGNFIDYQIIHGIGVKEMSSKICTKYPILLNEGFTETFASLIHMIFISYITKININTIFENELLHNVVIFNTLINYYKIDKIQDILVSHGCVSEFKQKTNVFSYYIIKIINYLNINNFLTLFKDHCHKNYKIDKSFNLLFVKFINQKIEKMNDYIIKNKNKSNSLKLTCYELNL
jgi:hypothetical protein